MAKEKSVCTCAHNAWNMKRQPKEPDELWCMFPLYVCFISKQNTQKQQRNPNLQQPCFKPALISIWVFWYKNGRFWSAPSLSNYYIVLNHLTLLSFQLFLLGSQKISSLPVVQPHCSLTFVTHGSRNVHRNYKFCTYSQKPNTLSDSHSTICTIPLLLFICFSECRSFSAVVSWGLTALTKTKKRI